MTFRVCDGCGGVDEHPRHSFTGVIEDVHPANEALTSTIEGNINDLVKANKLTGADAMALGRAFWDTTSTDLHIDCCAAAGCPKAGTVDGCDKRIEVWNGKTGKGMVEAAMKVRADNPKHFETQEA